MTLNIRTVQDLNRLVTYEVVRFLEANVSYGLPDRFLLRRNEEEEDLFFEHFKFWYDVSQSMDAVNEGLSGFYQNALSALPNRLKSKTPLQGNVSENEVYSP